MASRKKDNGQTSVRMVEQAAKKLGCGLIEFFERAARRAGLSSFDGKIEAARLERFKGEGPFGMPGYHLPAAALEFAQFTLETASTPRPRFAKQVTVRPVPMYN